jgi:steroid delta-isomerase-like uncharacterized protein
MGAGKDLWNQLEARYIQADWAGVASLYASDAVFADPFNACKGRDAIQAYFEISAGAFPDGTNETMRLVEEGDAVAVEMIYRGTNTGPLPLPDGSVIPATGKAMELSVASVLKVRDGKIVSERDYFDGAALMSQLGLMPGT